VGVPHYRPATSVVSPAFDPAAYIDRVLRPIGRAGSERLPHLVVRYALDQWPPDAADRDLLRRVDQVVDLWRRQEEGSTAGLAEACARCLIEDDRLRRNAAYLDPRWWRGRIRDWHNPGQLNDAVPVWAFTSADDTGLPSATAGPDRQPVPEPPEPADAVVRPELPPPTDLILEPSDVRVLLRWQAPHEAPTGITFTIERLGDADAWQFVAATPGTTAEDLEPPGGRRVTYRVVAEHAASGIRSAATLKTVVFTPPVADLAARQVRDGRVVGSWRMHPDASKADVWRTPHGSPTGRASGATIRAQAGGFDDPHPPSGCHTYSVVPVYQDPDGQIYLGRRAEVQVEVFDQPPPPRVSIGESREHESTRVTLWWDELPAGVFLQMRRSAFEPAGAAGDVLMMEEAEQVGQPVWNGQGFTGTTANLLLPAGRWILIPFAVAGARAVRGDCMLVDVVPPVSVPEAVRNGLDVQVSWAWPDGLRLARVVWRADGVDVPREITRSEFQGRGSVTFQRPEAASIRITGVVRSGADELTSAAVTVTAPPQPPTLTYWVKRLPGLPGLLPWSRRRRVVLAADLACVGLRAVIYVHAPGRGAESDVELAVRDDIDLGPGRSQDVLVVIPKVGKIARPCYLSCRVTNGSGELRVDHFASKGREIR
jgi:hypothetical protein